MCMCECVAGVGCYGGLTSLLRDTHVLICNFYATQTPSHQQYCLNSRQVAGNDVGVVGGGSLGGRPSDERTDV